MRILWIFFILVTLVITPLQAKQVKEKKSYYSIQIFVTKFQNKAKGLKKDWVERKSYFTQMTKRSGKYVVLVGKFSTRNSAKKELQKIKNKNSDNPLILKDKQFIKFFNGKKWLN